jgi:hypothetical protein
VFISYARADLTRIPELVKAFSAQGWDVFWDYTIPAGESWRSWIGKACSEARCVVVCWSRHAIESRWGIEEASEGSKRGVLVPCFLERVPPPWGFKELHGADLTDSSPAERGQQIVKLVEAVAARVGRRKPPTDEQPATGTRATEPPNSSSRTPRLVTASLGAITAIVLIGIYYSSREPGFSISDKTTGAPSSQMALPPEVNEPSPAPKALPPEPKPFSPEPKASPTEHTASPPYMAVPPIAPSPKPATTHDRTGKDTTKPPIVTKRERVGDASAKLSERCSALIGRAALGEPLSIAEDEYLKKECR